MWITISKSKGTAPFYPVNVLHKELNAKRLTYKQANEKPKKYWKNKNVLFHGVWANNYANIWLPLREKLAKLSRRLITEFDADKHINNLETLDKASWGEPLLLYNRLAKVSPNFIWELPMKYNPFIIDTTRIELSVYDKKFVREKKNKDIDFLGFIDTRNDNVCLTMRLLEVLAKQGYAVKCLMLSPKYIKIYNHLPFEIVKNSKFNERGQQVFYKHLERAKIYIDLTTRLTAGRNVYEALFNHCIPIAGNTYGSSKIGYAVDTLRINLSDLYSLSLNVHENYSTFIKEKQAKAEKYYGVERTVNELHSFAGT
jgi:hypothetical protein